MLKLWYKIYTGCPRRNVPDFGRVFLMLKYTNINQNTYVQSWTVTKIMAREKCGLLWGSTHCTCQLTVLSISVLECDVILRLTLALTAYLQADKVDQTLRDTGSLPCVSCIVLGTLRTTMTWVHRITWTVHRTQKYGNGQDMWSVWVTVKCQNKRIMNYNPEGKGQVGRPGRYKLRDRWQKNARRGQSPPRSRSATNGGEDDHSITEGLTAHTV
jgi:hypothetical protein